MDRYSSGRDRTKAIHEESSLDFWRFLKDMHLFERKCAIEDKQNAFLDAYSAYLKTSDPHMREQAQMIADELHHLDPQFTFVVR